MVTGLFLNGLVQYPVRISAETLSILAYPGFLQQTPRHNLNYAADFHTKLSRFITEKSANQRCYRREITSRIRS